VRPWAAVSAGVAVVLLGGTAGTYGFWSDQATVTGAAVVSGSLSMTINGEDTDTYTWTDLATSDLAPGESVAAVLTIGNPGDVPFTVTAQGQPGAGSNNGLRQKTPIVVRVGGSVANDGDTTYPREETCTGGTLTWDAILSNPGPDDVVTGTSFEVATGAALDVCVQATLETSSDNSLQNQEYYPELVFTATQKAVS